MASADGKSQMSQQVSFVIDNNHISQGEDDLERVIRPCKSPIDLNTISSLNAETNKRGSIPKGLAIRYENTEKVTDADFDEASMRKQATAICKLRGLEENEALLLESGLFCVSANNLQPSEY